NGNGSFSPVVAAMSGPGPNGTSFNGATWADFDNDGYPDLFIFNGAGHNWLFHNNRDGTFSQVHGAPFDTDPAQSPGAAGGDYDNDGFLDLFVVNGAFDALQHHNYLYHHNQGNSNAWIMFKLVGTVSNRSPIGAKVRVKATIRGKTYWQMREVTNGDGFAGNSLNPHFGLGDATNVDIVRIEWPSGAVQEF